MFRTARPLLAVLAVAATAVSGCTAAGPAGGTAAAAAAVAVPPPTWRDCTAEVRRQLGAPAGGRTYQCGQVNVPRDWNRPQDSGTYPISVVRVRAATQRERIGSLIVNPGGPGGSGVELALGLTLNRPGALPRRITDRFDVVGFDPRGTGRSAPVDCTDDADLDAIVAADPDPATRPAFDAAAAAYDRSARDCAAAYGDQLVTFSTEQAARDIDAVRAAVGDARTTYLGYSYGTLLGAVYARLFPTRVRALVLDGAIDPTADVVTHAQRQAQGFELAFDRFAAWCRSAGDACPIAADPRGRVGQALDRARSSPVRAADGRRVTAGLVTVGVVAALYSRTGWPTLATAVDGLSRGRPAGIVALADGYLDRDAEGRYSSRIDANTAVNCADLASAPTRERVRRLQLDWRARYPLFGGATATGLLSCVSWPGPHDPPPVGRAAGAPPVLVVGTTGDPATPYGNTARLAATLGVGRVVTWRGDGHTAYPQTRCVNDAVDRYLLELRVPEADPRCPAR